MFVKTYFLAVLAALAQALPSPAPEAEPEAAAEALIGSHLQRRQNQTPNGAIIFYSGTGYSTPQGGQQPLAIYAYRGQDAFCTLFTPIRQAPFTYRSYISASILFVGYTSRDCSGTGTVIVSVAPHKDCYPVLVYANSASKARANGNQQNTNVQGGPFSSFQAVYLADS